MEPLFVEARAKINLHLQVLPRRADGFHEIESVFARLDLRDFLRIRLTCGAGCKIRCGNFDLPAQNTISKAFDIFCEAAQKKIGLEVELQKNIPAKSGLGGGSSDGAAVLKALDFLCKTGFSRQDLMKMAEKIGSDAPFFLLESPFAIAGGRGEKLTACGREGPLFAAIIMGSRGVSTKWAYEKLDENKENFFRRDLDFHSLFAELQKNPSEWRFFNSFSPAVFGEIPEIQEEVALLRRCGALFAGMTGSGSAAFGIFDSADSAEKSSKIAKKMKKYAVSSCIK